MTSLDKSNMPFRKIVLFIYCWSKELTSIEFCKLELGIDKRTVVDWNNCTQFLANRTKLYGNCDFPQNFHTRKLGEISVFYAAFVLFTFWLSCGKWRANHYCRSGRDSVNSKEKSPRSPVITTMGVFRETCECFIYTAPDRGAATLLPDLFGRTPQ